MSTTPALTDYIAAALWTGHCYESEHDDNPEPLDSWAEVDDVPQDILDEMLGDLEGFSQLVEETCPEAFDAMSPEQMVHDFHLTRNGHGAGFWDRGLGELGDTLTDLAKTFGTAELEGHRTQDAGHVTVLIYLHN